MGCVPLQQVSQRKSVRFAGLSRSRIMVVMEVVCKIVQWINQMSVSFCGRQNVVARKVKYYVLRCVICGFCS